MLSRSSIFNNCFISVKQKHTSKNQVVSTANFIQNSDKLQRISVFWTTSTFFIPDSTKKLKIHFDNCDDDIEINGKKAESNRIIESYLEHYEIEKLADIESNGCCARMYNSHFNHELSCLDMLKNSYTRNKASKLITTNIR